MRNHPLPHTVESLNESRASAYDAEFWLIYLANGLTMTAFAMLVRYADLVIFLGGAEGQLGLIVGAGMIGSLAMRLAQGVGIDQYGARRIWLLSLAGYAASLVAHLAITSATGPGIFLARIAMQTSVAGVFGASITYISRRVPARRMAEMVGMLGTSGFLGILTGPQISDWICRGQTLERHQLDSLFLVTAGFVVAALLIVFLATRPDVARPVRRRQPPLWALVQRYHPGWLLVVGVGVGAGLAVPNTFLRTFAADRAIGQIGVFFAVYAVVALVVRVGSRRLFTEWGCRPFVLLGLGALAASIVMYLMVHQSWQLAFPGAVAGVAHALLFPAVVAGGSTAFPERYRGRGTTLMLASFDLGSLVGAPLIGGLLDGTRYLQLPAYPVTLVIVAIMLCGIAVGYALSERRGITERRQAIEDRLNDDEPPEVIAASTCAAPAVQSAASCR